MRNTKKKSRKIALAGVTQQTECQPANQRVTSSIPSQDTRLGCRPGPQQWAHERQPHTDISLPIFLLSPVKINKIFQKIQKNNAGKNNVTMNLGPNEDTGIGLLIHTLYSRYTDCGYSSFSTYTEFMLDTSVHTGK